VSGSSTRSAGSAAASPDDDAPGAGASPSEPLAASPSRSRHHVARAGLVAAVAGAVLVLDQLSKEWALSTLPSRVEPMELIGSLQLNLTWNTGTAFSLGSGQNLGPFVALLALLVVAYLLWSGQSRTKLGAVAAGMVAGGAIGNLLDRALRSGPAGSEAGFMGGAVVDFVDLQWWPVFNLADSAIVVGALLLFAVQWREADEPDAGEPDAVPPSTDPG
jgi:signal peptidase II